MGSPLDATHRRCQSAKRLPTWTDSRRVTLPETLHARTVYIMNSVRPYSSNRIDTRGVGSLTWIKSTGH